MRLGGVSDASPAAIEKLMFLFAALFGGQLIKKALVHSNFSYGTSFIEIEAAARASDNEGIVLFTVLIVDCQ